MMGVVAAHAEADDGDSLRTRDLSVEPLALINSILRLICFR
jgi:hypothetical protein